MSKEFGNESIETISTAEAETQVQLQIDDKDTPSLYSSTIRVSGTNEEINVDLGGPIRSTGPKTATLKIDQRIILNPWAAKRLALALGQAVQRYEQTFGTIELDPAKRQVNKK